MNRLLKRLTVGLYFRLVIVVIFIFSILVSTLIATAIERYMLKEPPVGLGYIYWFAILSIVMSSSVSMFVMRWILEPVTRLNDALSRVADGDFSVRLAEKSYISEIRESYSTFNAMVQDLTATETLQQSFITNVSHELKTPIGAIEGYATLMQGDEALTPDERENVDKILVNTHRLSELVGNILLLSKLENMAISVPRESFSLSEQIRQCIVAQENGWTEKQIELDVDMEEISFVGNEQLMYHVWQNLIGNAVKFSPRGGRISMRLMRREDGIVFTVSDDGPGISEDAIGHIFDKFYQGDTSHKTEGNGLGLSLVKHIADMHGGTVHAENRPEGGALFTVIFKA